MNEYLKNLKKHLINATIWLSQNTPERCTQVKLIKIARDLYLKELKQYYTEMRKKLAQECLDYKWLCIFNIGDRISTQCAFCMDTVQFDYRHIQGIHDCNYCLLPPDICGHHIHSIYKHLARAKSLGDNTNFEVYLNLLKDSLRYVAKHGTIKGFEEEKDRRSHERSERERAKELSKSIIHLPHERSYSL